MPPFNAAWTMPSVSSAEIGDQIRFKGMLADYRDWLGTDMYEAAGAIGGSCTRSWRSERS